MFNKKNVFLSIIFYSLNALGSDITFNNMPDQNGERHIVIVTAGYKNKNWYKKNLDSIFAQKYQNYHLMYVDDCSPDGTADLVEQYINEKGYNHKVTLIKNTERYGCPLANHYKAIHACDDKAIIVILDADDFFAHDRVLSYLNNVYSDSNVWLTYGQFVEYPSGVHGFCSPMPQHIVERNAFRDWACIPSHLRSFYAGLFKQIKEEDLKYDGRFFMMTGDMGAMMPMIEMARDHFKFIPDILYIYNAANELNEYKVSKDLQRKIDLYIRALPRYEKVKSPIRSK
jgi:glycosyltransferase involved in cell wall biosynthesis